MNTSSIILLTKEFPFGKGEAFLENEIMLLSEKFSKILIIACEVPIGIDQHRSIPTNVVLIRIDKKFDKIQKVYDIIANPLSLIKKDNALKEESKNARLFKQKVFLKYFDTKCIRIMEKIRINKIFISFTSSNDKIVIYSYWLFTTALVGEKISSLLRRRSKSTYMFTRAHRYDLYEEENSLNYLPYRTFLLQSYDIIYPVSNDGSAYLKKKYPEFTSKIQSSFLGTTDHGLGRPSEGDMLRILSVSRVEPVKQVIKLAEAILELPEEVKAKIQWTHIGDGSKMENLQVFVEEKMKGINIHLTGSLKNQEVLQYYTDNEIDVFINVSSSEGLPVSIMESISYGVPIIATDVGGTSEIVISGVTGELLSKEFTTNEINSRIKALFKLKNENYVEYIELRNRTRKFWKENFVAEDNYIELFDKIKEVF